MNKVELAYLAGVMDSDGSFTIGVERWRVRKLGRNPAYQEIAAIGQCDPQAIELAQKLFGGAIRSEKSRGPNRRPMWFWQVSNKIAVAAVRALLPYLRIKRRQAEILLRLRAIKDRGRQANTQLDGGRMVATRWGPRMRRFGHMKPEVLQEMESLAIEIRKMNDTRFPLSFGK